MYTPFTNKTHLVEIVSHSCSHQERFIWNYSQERILHLNPYHSTLNTQLRSSYNPITRRIFRAPHHFFSINKMRHLRSSRRPRWAPWVNSRVQIHLPRWLLRLLIQSGAEWSAHQHWDQSRFLRCARWSVPLWPPDYGGCHHRESEPHEEDLFHAHTLHLEPGLGHDGGRVVNPGPVILYRGGAYVREYAPLDWFKIGSVYGLVTWVVAMVGWELERLRKSW